MIKDGDVFCSNTVALVTSLIIALTSSNREQTQVPYFQQNHYIVWGFKYLSWEVHQRFLLWSILKSILRHWPPNSSALHQVSRAAQQRERSSQPIWRSSRPSRRRRRRRSCNSRVNWMRWSRPSGSWRSRWRERLASSKKTQFPGGGTHLSISGSADRWGRVWWSGVKCQSKAKMRIFYRLMTPPRCHWSCETMRGFRWWLRRNKSCLLPSPSTSLPLLTFSFEYKVDEARSWCLSLKMFPALCVTL